MAGLSAATSSQGLAALERQGRPRPVAHPGSGGPLWPAGGALSTPWLSARSGPWPQLSAGIPQALGLAQAWDTGPGEASGLQAPGPEGGALWGDEGGWGCSGGTVSQGNGCLEVLARWRLSVQQTSTEAPQSRPPLPSVLVGGSRGRGLRGRAGPAWQSLSLHLGNAVGAQERCLEVSLALAEMP